MLTNLPPSVSRLSTQCGPLTSHASMAYYGYSFTLLSYTCFLIPKYSMLVRFTFTERVTTKKVIILDFQCGR
jgi:hypothetical protein